MTKTANWSIFNSSNFKEQPIMWELKKEKNTPIYISIRELILSYIKTSILLPGERLPSERKLAELFSVNRSTVVHALEELVSSGWIIRKPGSGTIVNQEKWGIATASQTDWHHYLKQNIFIQKDPFIKEIELIIATKKAGWLDLYTGELAMELIPTFEFPALIWKHFLQEEEKQDDLGYLPLRKAISDEIKREYDFEVAPQNFLITSGAQQALYLILQVLLAPGDSVAVDKPSFFYTLPIFQATGIRLYGISTDEEGMSITELVNNIHQHKIKMIIVNPTFQNPTGNIMTMKRRYELIELCQKYKIPILEDDVFSQLSFLPKDKIQPLKKLAPENVLYVGSLSKILGSTTKIGWLSAPASVNLQLAQARKMMDFSLSIFPQLMAEITLTDNNFPQKIDLLKKQIDQRGNEVWQFFQEFEEWEVQKPQGGFYLWIHWTKRDLSLRDWQAFFDEKLLIAPSFVFGKQSNSFRINFSQLNAVNFSLFKEKIRKLTKKFCHS